MFSLLSAYKGEQHKLIRSHDLRLKLV